jgi:hypothetical protein
MLACKPASSSPPAAHGLVQYQKNAVFVTKRANPLNVLLRRDIDAAGTRYWFEHDRCDAFRPIVNDLAPQTVQASEMTLRWRDLPERTSIAIGVVKLAKSRHRRFHIHPTGVARDCSSTGRRTVIALPRRIDLLPAAYRSCDLHPQAFDHR